MTLEQVQEGDVFESVRSSRGQSTSGRFRSSKSMRSPGVSPHRRRNWSRLVKDAGVRWIGIQRPTVASECLLGPAEHVEFGKAEVAVHGRESGIVQCGLAPHRNGVVVSAPIVEEVA